MPFFSVLPRFRLHVSHTYFLLLAVLLLIDKFSPLLTGMRVQGGVATGGRLVEVRYFACMCYCCVLLQQSKEEYNEDKMTRHS